MAVTPNCQIIEQEILAKWPGTTFGRYKCRHIGSNPDNSWSQHAGSEPKRGYFGNALDIYNTVHNMDLIHAWLVLNETRLRVDQLLWRVAAHFDHIHVSTFPKMKSDHDYIPPCEGGELVVIYEDGTLGDTFGDSPSPPPPPTMEDSMWPIHLFDGADNPPADSQGRPWKNDDVLYIQKRLNRIWDAGLKADGVAGPLTFAAFFDLVNLPVLDTIDGRAGERFEERSIVLLSATIEGPEGPAGPAGTDGAPGPQPTSATFGYDD
jgi:hypothetical protein